MCRSCAHGVAILNFKEPTCGNHGHGPQSSILKFQRRSTRDSAGKRNHAHDFKFPENLKICSHGGPRSLTFHAPPRDSIAIPASLMRGEYELQIVVCRTKPPGRSLTSENKHQAITSVTGKTLQRSFDGCLQP